MPKAYRYYNDIIAPTDAQKRKGKEEECVIAFAVTSEQLNDEK